DAGDPERQAVVYDEGVGDRGAEHEDGAVGEIEDVEDSEHERVTDREQRVDGPDEDRIEELLVHLRRALKNAPDARVLRSGGPATVPHHQRQLGLIWWSSLKPPWPSISMTHTVCFTSCALVNWNGPSGVWMLTDSMA